MAGTTAFAPVAKSTQIAIRIDEAMETRINAFTKAKLSDDGRVDVPLATAARALIERGLKAFEAEQVSKPVDKPTKKKRDAEPR